jgi:nucleoside phosphorylase/tetratricopeptide (TPR) repeat protein
LSDQALGAAKNGDSDSALALALTVLERKHECGGYEQSGHLAVEILQDRSRFLEAEPIATRLAELNPKCALGFYQLALCREVRGDSLGAAQNLSKALSLVETTGLDASVTGVHAQLARAAAEAERIDLLDPFLDRWRLNPPQDDNSRFFWAICLIEAGQLPEAEEILRELLEDAPKGSAQAPYLHELGFSALERNDLDEAAALFRRSADVAESEAHRPFAMLAIVSIKQNKADDAVRWARRALAMQPNNIGYRINLASALALSRKFDEAIDNYREILAVAPTFHSVRAQLSAALLEAGHLPEALGELVALETSGWEPDTVDVNIGVVLARRRAPGDLDEALAKHFRALTTIRAGRRHAILILNVINMLSLQKRWSEALQLASSEFVDWPTWAIEEIKVLRDRIVREEQTTVVSDVFRVLGVEAGAALLGSVHGVDLAGLSVEGCESLPRTPKIGNRSERDGILTPASIQVVVVTALPHEFAAMKVMLVSPKEWIARGGGAGRRYLLGTIGRTGVALTVLADTGNNNASVRATQALHHLPAVKKIIICGIAGGLPAMPNANHADVRLGDIVVCNREGVIQYDFVRQSEGGAQELRSAPRPPDSELVEVARVLVAGELEGKRPWEKFLKRGTRIGAIRPADDLDSLGNHMTYMEDPRRRPGLPQVFHGAIASANILLKDKEKREELRALGAKAVEMEASGIADASWMRDGVGYFVVRGICDFCDDRKGDVWQKYAALAAASYTRALIEAL